MVKAIAEGSGAQSHGVSRRCDVTCAEMGNVWGLVRLLRHARLRFCADVAKHASGGGAGGGARPFADGAEKHGAGEETARAAELLDSVVADVRTQAGGGV